MNQNMISTSDIYKRFKAMDSENVRSLYEQYSEWSRHLHSEILTIATFGLTFSLGSLSFAFNPSIEFVQFCVLGISNLFFLFICHKFIESIKIQQANFWAIIDYIEVNWGIRDRENNMFGPLVKVSSKYRPGATGNQRRFLFVLTGLIWIIAILMRCL